MKHLLRSALLVVGTSLSLASLAQGMQSMTYIQHATCGNTDGTIVLSVWGGVAPYTYVWSPTPTTGQGTSYISGPAGMYSVTVTDSNADELIVDTEIILTPNLFPTVVPATEAWSCQTACDGNYYIWQGVNGVSPYTVTFDPPGPVGNATPNGVYLTQLCAGTSYMITVTDDTGCAGTIGPLDVIGPMAPQIISQTVSGSCPGGSTGSFTVEFNQVDSIIVSGPNGTFWADTSNPFTATNLVPGTYQVYASLGGGANPPGSSCGVTYQIEVPVSTDPCGNLNGIAYADLNGDCVQDAGDPGMPYRVLEIDPTGNFALTAADGTYGTELFYGAYELDASFANYAINCPVLPAAFTLDAVTPSATIDIAAEPAFGPDVLVSLFSGVHRPGFPVSYWVTIQNQGPYSFTDLEADLNYDPIINFISVEGPGSLTAAGHVEWTIPMVGPFETIVYEVELTIPNIPSLIGTTMTGIATVGPVPADSDPSNDSYTFTRTVVNSYDPNDKLASTSSQTSDTYYFLDIDEHIDYTIRFQNTGTAEAINVVVTDTISDLLNMLSLEILGASHAFTAEIATGRVLTFTFAGINLPDSTSDLLGSQGFVSFRLKPVNGLPVLTEIQNNADIFFDLNDPIRTNTATLITEMSVGIDERAAGMSLRPNPAQDAITIDLPQGIVQAEIIGADGRMLASLPVRTTTLRMDVSKLLPGTYLLRAIGGDGTLMQGRFVKH